MSLNKREPYFIVACGMRGVGKTYETLRMIKDYLRGNPAKGIVPRRVILIDPNNEFIEYPEIIPTPKMIKAFSIQRNIEARRVSIFKMDNTIKTMDELLSDVMVILENFRGGLCVIEDVSLLIGDSMETEFVGRLNTLRHRNCDVIIHFQTITRTNHPRIGAVTNILRFHKVGDPVEESRFGMERTPILKIAEALINNRHDEGSKRIKEIKRKYPDWELRPTVMNEITTTKNRFLRFFVFVHYDDMVIKGAFTDKEFKNAVFTVIQNNQKKMLKPELDKIDTNGNKVHKDTASALRAIEQFYLEKYFGN